MPTASNILRAEEINDLLLATHYDYGPPAFSQQAQGLQRYEIMSYLLKEDRMAFDSGIGLKRTIMTDYARVFEWVGFHQASQLSQTDHLQQLTVNWKHGRTHWMFDAKELMMNKGKALIANVIKPREAGAVLAMAAGLEDAGWDYPATTDEKVMYGFPYYVVWNEGSGGGFNGLVPSGHTTVAGINPTTYPTYANYTEDYTNITADDWLAKARKLHMKTEFVSPVDVDDFRGDTGKRFKIYTSDDGMIGMWELADQRNQNLQWDLGKQDNQTTFKGNALRHVPKLDSENISTKTGMPTDPFYFIDKASFIMAALEQDYMRRSEAMNSREQPDSYVNYIFASLQMLCVIRRRNGVMGWVA